MKTYLKAILFLFFVAVFGLILFSAVEFLVSSKNISKVCFKNNCFEAEIAKTQTERQKGLMGRNELGSNKGMFFIFDKDGVYSFWMKNTLLPLDIIWLDNNYKVVYIKENAKPCDNDFCERITPNSEARYVLEVNGGICDKLKIKIGDIADFTVIKN